MCYVLVLATSSPADLSRWNTELVQFRRDMPTRGVASVEATALRYPFKWYVGSRSGCSCSFRHLYFNSVELGFGEPEAWFPEEPEDIAATLEFMAVVRTLVGQGHAVECIDAWEHGEPEPGEHCEATILLGAMKDTEFRFFEGHRFTFSAAA